MKSDLVNPVVVAVKSDLQKLAVVLGEFCFGKVDGCLFQV